MTKQSILDYEHHINPQDEIIFVSKTWLNFAKENLNPELTSSKLFGKKLWSFISNEETISLYKTIIQKIRKNKSNISLPFRCDSPSLKRYMQMDISINGDTIIFRSLLLKTEHRDPVHFESVQNKSALNFLHMCSWCKQIKLPDNMWVEVEDAVTELNLFNTPELPLISHVICESCHKKIKNEIEKMNK